jgi:uncharacterized membrane protein YadS
MTFLYSENTAPDGAKTRRVRSLLRAVPLFLVGFVIMSLVRTGGDMWLTTPAWPMFVDSLQSISQACLTVAMAAVGLGTRFSAIRQLGIKPLAVGFAAAALVGAVGIALIRLLVPGSM